MDGVRKGGMKMKTMKKWNWKQWPVSQESTRHQIEQVLHSNRWAITGYWTGQNSMEQQFAEKFADFHQVDYCLPTTNCTSALQLSMEALDIGYGDEVIVPALTWVATVTAVLNVNATPILVDIDPHTYCIDPQKIEHAITDRTKAVIPVHLYSSMANMDDILSIAQKYDLFVIEDCAQSHGAEWDGQKAGTLGDIGCFSMQHGKVITSGEGGALITKRAEIYKRLDRLRADSRARIQKTDLRFGDMEIVPNEVVIQGNNHCLSEFQSAILIDQVNHFEEQNKYRNEQALYVNEQLQKIPGICLQTKYPKNKTITIYSYCIKLDRDIIQKTPQEICAALIEKTGLGTFFVHPSYPAVHQNPIFCPWTKKRYPPEIAKTESYWRNLQFEHAERAHEETVVFHHSLFLNDREHIDYFLECLTSILTDAG